MGFGFAKSALPLVFYGKTRYGKTHLAVVLGIACVNAGYEAQFFSVVSFARRLTTPLAEGTLESPLKNTRRADVVILDEFDYIPLDVDGALRLF